MINDLEHGEGNDGNEGGNRERESTRGGGGLKVADGGALASSVGISLEGCPEAVRVRGGSLALEAGVGSERFGELTSEVGDAFDDGSEVGIAVVALFAEDAQGAEFATVEELGTTEATNHALADSGAASRSNVGVTAVDCASNDDAKADIIASGEEGAEFISVHCLLDLRIREQVVQDVPKSGKEIVKVVEERRAARRELVASRLAPLPSAMNNAGGVVDAQHLRDEVRTADGAQSTSDVGLNGTEALREVTGSVAAETVARGIDVSNGSLQLGNAVDLVLLLLSELAVGTDDIDLRNCRVECIFSLCDSGVDIVRNSNDAIESGR